MRHETAIWDKKPNPDIPVFIFGGSFLLCQQQKTQKSVETHIFMDRVLANLKKRIFKKKKLKTEKFEKPNFCTLFWKRLF